MCKCVFMAVAVCMCACVSLWLSVCVSLWLNVCACVYGLCVYVYDFVCVCQ